MKVLYNENIPREQQIFNNVFNDPEFKSYITVEQLPQIHSINTNIAEINESTDLQFEIQEFKYENNIKQVIVPYYIKSNNIQEVPASSVYIDYTYINSKTVVVNKIIPYIKFIHPIEFIKQSLINLHEKFKYRLHTTDIFIKHYSNVIHDLHIYNINNFTFDPTQIKCKYSDDRILTLYNIYPNHKPLESQYGLDVILTQFEINILEYWKNKCIIKIE